MTNVLLLEDDLFASRYLIDLFNIHLPNINVSHAKNIKEAMNLVQSRSFDLLVLDVDLGECENEHIKNGIDFAEYFRKLPGNEFTWIVFISAYSSFLSESFTRSHCYDYIIKPIEPIKFVSLIRNLAMHKVSSIAERKYLTINRRDYLLKINVNDIDYIEIFRKQSSIFTKDNQHVVSRYPLKEMLKQLPEGQFAQCHRSYIVNIYKITGTFLQGTYWYIRLLDRLETIPLGDSYRDLVLNKMKK